eukprot:30943-Pelagococcus_subviridis.AAC.22
MVRAQDGLQRAHDARRGRLRLRSVPQPRGRVRVPSKRAEKLHDVLHVPARLNSAVRGFRRHENRLTRHRGRRDGRRVAERRSQHVRHRGRRARRARSLAGFHLQRVERENFRPRDVRAVVVVVVVVVGAAQLARRRRRGFEARRDDVREKLASLRDQRFRRAHGDAGARARGEYRVAPHVREEDRSLTSVADAAASASLVNFSAVATSPAAASFAARASVSAHDAARPQDHPGSSLPSYVPTSASCMSAAAREGSRSHARRAPIASAAPAASPDGGCVVVVAATSSSSDASDPDADAVVASLIMRPPPGTPRTSSSIHDAKCSSHADHSDAGRTPSGPSAAAATSDLAPGADNPATTPLLPSTFATTCRTAAPHASRGRRDRADAPVPVRRRVVQKVRAQIRVVAASERVAVAADGVHGGVPRQHRGSDLRVSVRERDFVAGEAVRGGVLLAAAAEGVRVCDGRGRRRVRTNAAGGRARRGVVVVVVAAAAEKTFPHRAHLRFFVEPREKTAVLFYFFFFFFFFFLWLLWRVHRVHVVAFLAAPRRRRRRRLRDALRARLIPLENLALALPRARARARRQPRAELSHQRVELPRLDARQHASAARLEKQPRRDGAPADPRRVFPHAIDAPPADRPGGAHLDRGAGRERRATVRRVAHRRRGAHERPVGLYPTCHRSLELVPREPKTREREDDGGDAHDVFAEPGFQARERRVREPPRRPRRARDRGLHRERDELDLVVDGGLDGRRGDGRRAELRGHRREETRVQRGHARTRRSFGRVSRGVLVSVVVAWCPAAAGCVKPLENEPRDLGVTRSVPDILAVEPVRQRRV